MAGPNADLWLQFWGYYRAHGGNVTVTKVKAHATEAHLEAGLSTPQHMVGNHLADWFAGLGAKANQVSAALAQQLKQVDATTRLILRRLVAVCIACGEAAQPEPAARVPRPRAKRLPLQHLVRQSPHALSYSGGRWRCKLCGCTSTKRSLRQWLAGSRSCLAPELAATALREDAPKVCAGAGAVVIGGVTLHASHHLSARRGIFWCRTCGQYATAKAMGLGKQCPGGASATGRYILGRLSRGLAPHARVNWPLPE